MPLITLLAINFIWNDFVYSWFFLVKNKNDHQLLVFKRGLLASVSFDRLQFPVLVILDFMDLGYWDP